MMTLNISKTCLAAVLSVLMLNGCASCDPKKSLPCGVFYLGVYAVGSAVAPVFTAIDKQKMLEEKEERLKRLEANDPNDIARCLIDFYRNEYYSTSYRCKLPDSIDSKKRTEINQRSLDQIISLWAENPLAEQKPVLMVSYLYKGIQYFDSDPAQAEIFLREAARLSAEADTKALFDNFAIVSMQEDQWGGYKYFYAEKTKDIQYHLMILRHHNRPEQERSADSFKCQPIGAWPPAWAEPDLTSVCRRVVRELFNIEWEYYPLTSVSEIYNPISPEPHLRTPKKPLNNPVKPGQE